MQRYARIGSRCRRKECRFWFHDLRDSEQELHSEEHGNRVPVPQSKKEEKECEAEQLNNHADQYEDGSEEESNNASDRVEDDFFYETFQTKSFLS